MTNEPKTNPTEELISHIQDIMAQDSGALLVVGHNARTDSQLTFVKGEAPDSGSSLVILLALAAFELAENAPVPLEELADIIKKATLKIGDDVAKGSEEVEA